MTASIEFYTTTDTYAEARNEALDMAAAFFEESPADIALTQYRPTEFAEGTRDFTGRVMSKPRWTTYWTAQVVKE